MTSAVYNIELSCCDAVACQGHTIQQAACCRLQCETAHFLQFDRALFWCTIHATHVFNCRRTPDGSAYPLDMPWGNSGTIMNGMCAAAMYQFIQVDQPTHPVYKDASCFLRQQLGYFFNHKCTHTGSCNTGASSEGFSYQVGCVLQLLACSCTLVLRDVCAVCIVPSVQLLRNPHASVT